MSFSVLPPELSSAIFANLPPLDLTRGSCVCKGWRDMICSEDTALGGGEWIWRLVAERFLGGPKKGSLTWRKFGQNAGKQLHSMQKAHLPGRLLRWSVASGHWVVLRDLISREGWKGQQLDDFNDGEGVGSNAPTTSRNRTTPLLLAITGGHIEAARVLVAHGANVALPNGKGTTPLQAACSKGFLSVVDVLLEHGAEEVEALQGKQGELLHRAVAGGHLNLMERLLFLSGGDAECRDSRNQRTLLHTAAIHGEIKAAACLVEGHGVDINCVDKDGASPLYFAVAHNRFAMLRYLHEKGATIPLNPCGPAKTTIMHIAANLKNWEVLRYLLSHGATLGVRSSKGRTPLQMAATNGQLGIVRMLLEIATEVGSPSLPQDINVVGGGRTALDCAIDRTIDKDFAREKQRRRWQREQAKMRRERSVGGKEEEEEEEEEEKEKEKERDDAVVVESDEKGSASTDRGDPIAMVRLLLKYGADANIGARGVPPLLNCISYDEEDNTDDESIECDIDGDVELQVIEVLLQHGVSINTRSSQGDSIVHKAAERGRLKIMKRVVELGADINLKRSSDLTPLHTMTGNCKRRRDVAQFLLDKGLDVNAVSTAGFTPLLESKDGRFTRFLIEHGADVNAASNDKWNGIHCALDWPRSEDLCFGIIETLLQHGTDANAQNSEMNTPMHLLCSREFRYHFDENQQGQIRILNLLLAHGAAPSLRMKNAEGRTPRDCAVEAEMSYLVEELKKREMELEETELQRKD